MSARLRGPNSVMYGSNALGGVINFITRSSPYDYTTFDKKVRYVGDRVAAVAQRLALLPVERPVVTIAGTNGKGSVAAMLHDELEHREAQVGTGHASDPNA